MDEQTVCNRTNYCTNPMQRAFCSTFGQRNIDHNCTNHIYNGGGEGVEVKIEGADNYLYLNVHSVKPDKPRPVMVWIYGRGFCSGEATREQYASDYFMRKDVISVTTSIGRFNCPKRSPHGKYAPSYS
nr:acetylcholinesterase-like [Bactrocera oleae]